MAASGLGWGSFMLPRLAGYRNVAKTSPISAATLPPPTPCPAAPQSRLPGSASASFNSDVALLLVHARSLFRLRTLTLSRLCACSLYACVRCLVVLSSDVPC